MFVLSQEKVHLCKVDIEKYRNTRKKPNIFLWLVLVYKVLRTSLPFVCWQDFKKFVVFDCSVRFLFYIFYFTGKKNWGFLSVPVCNWKCQRWRRNLGGGGVGLFFFLIHWFPLALHLVLQFSSIPGLLAHGDWWLQLYLLAGLLSLTSCTGYSSRSLEIIIFQLLPELHIGLV